MHALNRTPRMLITALLIMGLFIFVGCGNQVNSVKELILNGNFENSIDDWSLEAGVKNGKDNNKYLTDGSNWQVYQILNLIPNATYNFSASSRKGIGKQEARLKIIFFDKHAKRLGYYNITFKHEGKDWEKIPAQSIKVPANTAETIIYMLPNQEEDTQVFENISLTKKTDGATALPGEETTITFYSIKELLMNSSLNNNLGWSGLKDRVKTDSDGNKYLVNNYNWDVAQSFSVIPNQKYEFSARTRKGTASGAARFVITFLDAQGKSLEPSYDFTYQHQSTDWEAIPTKTIVVPAGTEKARLFILTDKKSEGFHDFDDISLTTAFPGGDKKTSETSSPEPPENQEFQGKENEPKELKEITKNIESIIMEVRKKQEMAKKPPQEQNASQGDGKQDSSGDKQYQGWGQQSEQGNTQENPLQNWDKEEKSVTEIHKKWNILEIEVIKAGANNTLRNEFETDLNTLTNKIMAKDIMETLKTANKLYGIITKISDLYQSRNPSEVDMMKYYTQKALFAIEEENWAEAANNINYLKELWEKTKIMMGEEGAKLMVQMDYGIIDFSKSIENQNKAVGRIKGEIIMDNIEKVVAKIEKINR